MAEKIRSMYLYIQHIKNNEDLYCIVHEGYLEGKSILSVRPNYNYANESSGLEKSAFSREKAGKNAISY